MSYAVENTYNRNNLAIIIFNCCRSQKINNYLINIFLQLGMVETDMEDKILNYGYNINQ